MAAHVVHLIRHADARSRDGWLGDDRLRPLTAYGEAQGALLGHELAEHSIVRLVSSPALRCIETLAPLSDHLGHATEPIEVLGEGHDAADALEALLAVTADLPDRAELAACSHGDVIPELIDVLIESGVELEGGRTTPKAVRFAIHVEDGKVTRVVRHPPPHPDDTSTRS
jgi:phosphohistidine phosphatase SixA